MTGSGKLLTVTLAHTSKVTLMTVSLEIYFRSNILTAEL